MDDLQELERSLTSVQKKRPAAPAQPDLLSDEGVQSGGLLKPGKRIKASQSASSQDVNDGISTESQTGTPRTRERNQPSILKNSLQTSLIAAAAGGINYFLLLIILLGTLLIGAGVWYAYNQGVLKGSEAAAPTLQATGPIKSAPDAPGGLPIPDPVPQIYSQLDGQDDPDQIEALLPAPEDPMRPLLESLERQGESASSANNGELSSPDLPSIVNPPPLSPEDITVEAQRIDQTRLPAAFGSQLEPEAVLEPEPAAANTVAANAAIPQNAPQNAQQNNETQQNTGTQQPDDSLPAPRVASETESQQQASLSPVPQNPTPQTPASVPNPWRIQLAALKSPQEAEAFWRTQQALHPDLLQRLTLGIEPVQVNGKPYFRVRVGPLPDEGAAINLCANIRARGQACLLVRP